MSKRKNYEFRIRTAADSLSDAVNIIQNFIKLRIKDKEFIATYIYEKGSTELEITQVDLCKGKCKAWELMNGK